MCNNELVNNINRELEAALPQDIPTDEIIKRLSELVNDLIERDFQKLVFILYKTDVSESKLRLLLQHNSGQDAAPVIAKLIIERELQKIESRNLYRSGNINNEEERW